MKGFHQFLITGYLFPKAFRDFIYNLIANRRNQLSNNSCDINNYKDHPRFIQ